MNGPMPAISSGSRNDMSRHTRIMRTTWQESETALRAVRTAVFVREQRVPEELEWDEFDPGATHFLAVDEAGEAVGCVRLLDSGQISRLCVLEPLRNQGIGRLLLNAVEEEARARGMSELFLHAQTHATGFYEAEGFIVNGGIFLEADIPHRQMIKELTS